MNFEVSSYNGELWYIFFVNQKGIKCFLPTRRKFFGRWSVNNCPRSNAGHKSDVYLIQNNGDSTPHEVLTKFQEKYETIEEYLEELNNKK